MAENNWTFLAAGTDGQDGPTPAAGAFRYSLPPTTSTSTTASSSAEQGEDLSAAVNALENNDAFTHYQQVRRGDYLVSTGLTGTNVMDIHLFLFDYSQ